MTNIVFLDRDTFPEEMHLKQPSFDHEWQQYEGTDPADVIDRLKNADIAIVNKVPLDKSVMAALPKLKMIAIAATGFNHIDIAFAKSQGIIVSNIRGYATQSVPEHALMMIMALSRSAFAYRNDVADMQWQKAKNFCFFAHPVEDLSGKTLCIVGRGDLGLGLAKLGQALGMQIIFAGRKGSADASKPYTPFEECLEISDVISVHCPLTDQTKDLFTEVEFKKMHRRPILINTARGGIINEEDAVAAVKSGLISGLGFDVLSKEPPTNGNPLLSIANEPNVIITPHIAWASSNALTQAWDQVIENIECFEKGSARNQVLPT